MGKNKILAIKGDKERGSEVIALLEMLGGVNKEHCQGIELGAYYYIDIHGCITYEDCFIEDELEIFTLEEFLEKYPFKVGDKIPDVWGNSCTVKSMSWDENYKTVMYGFKETIFVVRGDELYMTNIVNNAGLKIEKNMNTNIEFDLTKYSYEIKEGKLVVSEKTPKYPTTYAECKEMLDENVYYGFSVFMTLQNLIICRDAYWKIAGEQMGLNKHWKPEYKALEDNTYFTIQTFNGGIDKSATSHRNAILAFPTIEMRDAFYENFKDLIEECKELL